MSLKTHHHGRLRGPLTAVLVEPYHGLGYELCQHLSKDGVRLVTLGRDPEQASDFCTRLARQGCCAAYRFFHPEQPECSRNLAADLKRVYPQLNALISFTEPNQSENGFEWLSLPAVAARSWISRQLGQRLELMQSLETLFVPGESLIVNVVMESGKQPMHAVSALEHNFNQQLTKEWARRRISVRNIRLDVVGEDPQQALMSGLQYLLKVFLVHTASQRVAGHHLLSRL